MAVSNYFVLILFKFLVNTHFHFSHLSTHLLTCDQALFFCAFKKLSAEIVNTAL